MADPFYLLVFAAFCRGALPERQWMKVPEVFLWLSQKSRICFIYKDL
jgi:hypothetical protein